MYACIDIVDNNDYFLSYDKRKTNTVYFTRYIGYNDIFIPFLEKYYNLTKECGVYLNTTPLLNPTSEQVQDFMSKTVSANNLDISHVSKDISIYLPELNQSQKILLTDSILDVISILRHKGMNQNIQKNSYIKFMCWIRMYFINILKNTSKNIIPKILYEGNIGKYDIYMLKILSNCGCDIVYFNCDNDNSYLKYDRNNEFSNVIEYDNRGSLTKHFTEKTTTKNTAKVVTNTWIDELDLFELLFKTNNIRSLQIISSTIYNLYACYQGIDEKEEYNNRLYDLKENFKSNNKPYVIVENSIPNPTFDEASKIKRFQPSNKEETLNKLAKQIQLSKDEKINLLFQDVFINHLRDMDFKNISKLYNEGNKLICWLNRYLVKLFSSFDNNMLPCFIFFGNCNKHEALFLDMLSCMPIDVIYISPKKDKDFLLNETCLKIELNNESNEFSKYPDSKFRVRVATTAYSAERQLDEILYTGTGLYREHQFLYSKPVTLKTTFEEIQILWKEEAKYRPEFCIQDNNDVILPNIFAKVCGVKDDDIQQYIRQVRSYIDEDTITINKFPHFTDSNTSLSSIVRGFHDKNGKLLIDLIKKHPSYKYDYLTDNIQDYILEKIQELIDLSWISLDNNKKTSDIILEFLLNLDKKTLQLIQRFDFTKKVPKLVLLSVNESMFSIKDCIYICFLNLVGFDILIFTPTGYRNIEKYVTSNIFETYTIGNYKYDLEPFELKFQGNVNSFFTKFFKGR